MKLGDMDDTGKGVAIIAGICLLIMLAQFVC